MVVSTGGVKWANMPRHPEPGTIGYIVWLSEKLPGPSDYTPRSTMVAARPKGGKFGRGGQPRLLDQITLEGSRRPGPTDYAEVYQVGTELPGYVPFFQRNLAPDPRREEQAPPTRCRILRTFRDPALTQLVSVRSDADVATWEELARPCHTSCRPGARMLVPEVVVPFPQDAKRFQMRVDAQEASTPTAHNDGVWRSTRTGTAAEKKERWGTMIRAPIPQPGLPPPREGLEFAEKPRTGSKNVTFTAHQRPGHGQAQQQHGGARIQQGSSDSYVHNDPQLFGSSIQELRQISMTRTTKPPLVAIAPKSQIANTILGKSSVGFGFGSKNNGVQAIVDSGRTASFASVLSRLPGAASW
ncbi:hypothetical protein T484DRAFT_1937370 [Baffinella frigidus]|nr:hypothetical protein T484DRAFT_1937370 [Cryptophyta sp. CCMP2293]